MQTNLLVGYLHFHNCEFEGSEAFYREREKRFQVDHGMVLVNSHAEYLEVACFSGCLAKKPLHNIFINQLGVFQEFTNYFKAQLSPRLLNVLENGVGLSDFEIPLNNETLFDMEISSESLSSIIVASGWESLLLISKRERDCLTWLRRGLTYFEIGKLLNLSERTVEHYIDSVKNKLGLETRSELFIQIERMVKLGLIA